jgi:predicted SAM-dependent methyltransferase
MKLNIGCGQRCFDDYMNIDLDERKDTKYPYLKADALNIPLDNAVADEILTVHIFEHFWPWDIGNVLREWKRLLKDGGKLIIECPNLANSAGMFFNAVRNKDIKAQMMLMNCFYGDPKDRDLPGRHKWGYTPDSLISILNAAGFKECKQEPAQFKMKEPRDMRITGVK